MKKFYITNAIAYVNAAPHIGHVLELVQGDALARYHRQAGDDTYFLVGTDEHGTKIQAKAKELGKSPQELADENSEFFVDIHKRFNASNDDFIRTSSERHRRGAQKLWNMIDDAGMFYEKEYEGKYCVGCESFKQDKDLVDGKCPDHQKEPDLLKEKNIFFKLSDYSDAIKAKVESGELLIRPESRRNEFLSLLEEGLQDVSFSRPKKSLEWGIEVPGHEDQVMYVWCDALANYMTALDFENEGDLYKKYWPADVHLIGKDILRFHCGIWIGMLMAAGIELPKAIFIHGFITSEGQKMSKSLGNVVDPFAILDEFGTDPVRYYLLREIPTADDGDFSRDRFLVVYADELQNTIGNLVRRVVAMTKKYFDGVVPEGDGSLDNAISEAWNEYRARFDSFNIKMAIEAMLDLAREGNAYVDQNKPWELAKSDEDKLKIVLGNLLVLCRAIGEMLLPIIPDSAGKLLEQVGEDSVLLGEPLFPPIQEQ